MPRFDPDYPMGGLKPAVYNPRHLSDEAAGRLEESISRFGIQKPVIVNGSGTLVAGHQRVKTLRNLGWDTVPAVVLDRAVPLTDEICFNLLHNSIETDKCEAAIPPSPTGWQWIEAKDLVCGHNDNAAVVKEICRLLARYGTWGSIVADVEGRVLANADYALACKILGLPVLAAVLEAKVAEELVRWLRGDYGVYSYGALGIKNYNQMLCQPHRKATALAPTYAKLVIPNLQPGERIVDFGSGVGREIIKLQQAGREAYCYEPNLRAAGTHRLDIPGVVRQVARLESTLRQKGQFDVVVLDSVINSVTTMEFANHVLTCCNALCADDGRFYMATRSREGVEAGGRTKWSASDGRLIEFLDPEGFSAVHRSGAWTIQLFMGKAELHALLGRYFEDVVSATSNSGYHRCVCRRPRPLDPAQLRASLEAEFNMVYPEGFQHGRHRGLVEEVARLVADRDRQP